MVICHALTGAFSLPTNSDAWHSVGTSGGTLGRFPCMYWNGAFKRDVARLVGTFGEVRSVLDANDQGFYEVVIVRNMARCERMHLRCEGWIAGVAIGHVLRLGVLPRRWIGRLPRYVFPQSRQCHFFEFGISPLR